MKNTRFAMKNKAGMKSLTGKICRFFDKITHRAVGEAAPQPVEARGAAHNAHARASRPTAPVRRKSRCLRVGLVAVCTALGVWVGGVQAAETMNGKMTLKIEKKVLTPAQAQNAMTNKTPIFLKVSMIMRGDWVTRIDTSKSNANLYAISFGMSSFAFGIVTGESVTAPVDNNPKAYILSEDAGNCRQDGISLGYAAANPPESPVTASWWNGCPIREYVTGLESGNLMTNLNSVYRRKGSGDAGDGGSGDYYEIDLFYIGLILKSGTPQTVYVRGTDIDGYAPTDNTTDMEASATTRTTQINLRGAGNVAFSHGDGTSADWTYCTPALYGGIIPGGIFINTDAEVTQFAPVYASGKSAFCPGENVVFSATVKLPSGDDGQRQKFNFLLKDGTTTVTSIGGNSTTNTFTNTTTNTKIEFTDGSNSTTNNKDVTLKVTMPWTEYIKHITGKSNHADGSTYGGTPPTFTFAVVKTSDLSKPIGSKNATPAGVELPKLRLHVSNSNAAPGSVAGLGESPYTRTPKNGSSQPYDIVSGMDAGSTVYVRGTCNDDNTFAYSCYSGKVSSFALYENLTGSWATAATSATTNGQNNYVRYYLKVGAKPGMYAGVHTWSTGCVTNTDTIMIKPATAPPAPKVSITNNDCGTGAPTFEITAEAPSGLTLTINDWEWVVRSEYYNPQSDGSFTPVTAQSFNCFSYSNAADKNPLNKPSDATLGAKFGGGVIYNTAKGFTKLSKYQTTGTYSVKFQSEVTVAAANKTKFTAENKGNYTSRSDSTSFVMASNCVGGWWMPAEDIAAINTTSQFDNCGDYYSGANKWVYVRYKTADGWSEWGSTFTRLMNVSSGKQLKDVGMVPAFATLYSDKKFGINRPRDMYSSTIGGNTFYYMHPGPNFITSPSSDTVVISGSPVQFSLVTDASIPSTYTNISWQSSTDGGTTWSEWANVPAGTTTWKNITRYYSYSGNNGMFYMLPAPTVVRPTQTTQYRAVYKATCSDANDASNITIPITVSMFVNVAKGEIKADLGGGVLKQTEYITLCADTVDLVLQNYEPGAALQWEKSDNGSSGWTALSGMTSDRITYRDFAALSSITEASGKYKNGDPKFFRVKVTSGSESPVYSPVYRVIKHYAMKPTMDLTSMPKLITSGVCDGSEIKFAAKYDKYLTGTNAAWTMEQSTDYGVTFGAMSGVSVDASGSSSTTTAVPFKYGYKKTVAAADNFVYVRHKHTNNGCVAYSDTIKIRVLSKPTTGTVTPTEFCPGVPFTLSFSGTGQMFDWKYAKPGTSTTTDLSITSSSSKDTLIPEAAVGTGSGCPTGKKCVTVMVTPTTFNRAFQTGSTTAYDETVCYIDGATKGANSTPFAFVQVGSNCELTLTPNPTAMCGNDTKDVELTLAPPQAKSGTVTLQYSLNGGGTSGTWTAVPDASRTWIDDGTNYTKVKVLTAFFNGKASATPVKFRVVVRPSGATADLSPSSEAGVTVHTLPAFPAKTVTLSPAEICEGDAAGEKLTTTAISATGTASYEWLVKPDGASAYIKVGGATFPTGVSCENPATKDLTIKATAAISYADLVKLNNYDFKLARKIVSTTTPACTVYDTTEAKKPKINPLPDTAKFVKSIAAGSITDATVAKTVSMVSCINTPVTLTATLDGTLKAGSGTTFPKHTDYTYTWKEGNTTLANGTGGYAITNNGSTNTSASCVVPATVGSAAGLKTFTLTVAASAYKAGATGTAASDYGCPRSVTATYKITYNICPQDTVKIGHKAYIKGGYRSFCEDTNVWPTVSIAPVTTLKKADNSAATITGQTLYHVVKKADGSYDVPAQVGTSANATPPVYDVKNSSTAAHKTPGSHYYFAIVTRDGGYGSRVSDTVEYVIGGLPVNTLPGSAAVKAASSNNAGNNNNGVIYQQATATAASISACAGMKVDLAVSGMPTEPTDATAATGIAKGNGTTGGANYGYTWLYHATTSAIPAVMPTTGYTKFTEVGATRTVNTGLVTGNAGFYHVYRTYQRNTKINSLTTATYQTCEKTYPIGTAEVKVVAMPTKPAITVAADPSPVCSGSNTTLKQTATPGAAPSGHTWTYRWVKNSPTPLTADPAFGTAAASTAANKTLTALTADESWTLWAYAVNTVGGFSCYDTSKVATAIAAVKALPTLNDITFATTTENICGPNINVTDATSRKTVTLSTTAAPSGTTYTYKWYKRNSGATGNATAQATLVSDAAGRYSGATTKDLVITGNLTTGQETAGDYFVEITAKNSDGTCPVTKISTNAVKVNVYDAPGFKDKLDYTAGGISGTECNICKGELPALTWAPKSGVTPTYAHKAFVNNGDGVMSNGNKTFTLAAGKTNAVETKNYTWTLLATSNGCKKDTSIVFKVNVSDCSKDAVFEVSGGSDLPRDAVTPIKVCSNVAAASWPKVKIEAKNMAARVVSKIELYHSTKRNGAAASAAYAKVGTDVTPNAATGTLTFDPTTVAATKTVGSHFYYAVVTRAGSPLYTDTVEYLVGALAPRSVVSGGHIAVKQTTTAPTSWNAATKDSLLQMCVGETEGHVYWVGPSTALPANVSFITATGKWYESATHVAVPDLPTSLGAAKATNDTKYSPGVQTPTMRTKKFYYHFRQYRYTNAFTYATATTALTCDTTYPANSVGILIVNPRPAKVTAMTSSGPTDKCSGDVVTLTGTPLTPATPASGTTQTYRWLRSRGCEGAGSTTTLLNPTTAPAANADWATKFNAGLSQAAFSSTSSPITVTETFAGCGASKMVDVFKLVVYGKAEYTDNTYGNGVCYDSSEVLSGITIKVSPPPTVAPTISAAQAKCLGTGTVSLTITPGNNAGSTPSYRWFKFKGTGSAGIDTTRDMELTSAMSLYSGIGAATLTITASNDSVGGKYYALVKASSGSCEVKAFSSMQTVTVYPQPNPLTFVTGQTVNTVAGTTYSACAGKEAVVLQVNTNASAANVNTYTYTWSAKPFGTTADLTPAKTGSKVDITAANTVGQTGNKTFTLKVTGTSTNSCAKDTTVNFTVKLLDCGPDGIAAGPPAASTTKWPSAFSHAAPASVVICKSTADSASITGAPGKPLNLVPNPLSPDDRGAITSAIWYYAPVKEALAGGKLDVDWANAKKAKTCSTSPVTQTNCAYHPAKDAAEEGGAKLNTNGEWMIWIKIKRANSAVETYSDTISYVVRENPTISNLANIKLGWSSSVPANKLVCEGTAVTLQTSAAPVYAAPSAGGKRGETAYSAADDETKYEWTNAINGGAYGGAATTPTYTPFGAAKSGITGTTLSTGAPTGTKYQDNFRLTEEYWRKYVRTAGSTSGYKLPTYNIKCMTVDPSNVKVVKTMYDTLFTSIAPAGVLKDAANNQAKSYCTSGIDASTKITLKFTPDATTPNATITEWEWHDGSAWKTGANKWAAANSTPPNQIEIDLSDSRLVKPTAGLQKVYKFRGKTKNGACEGTTGEYTLTIEGEVTPGTLALDKTSLCAGSEVKATPSGIAPTTAKVTITFYNANPGTALTPAAGATAKGNSGEQTASALMSSGWSNSSAGTTSEVTAATGPKTYYARAVVKATSSICNDKVSNVVSATFYPTPTFTLGAATPNTICLTDDAEVEIAFTKSTSVDAVKVYTFNAALSPANKTTASAADAAHTKTLNNSELSAGKFKLAKAQLYDNSSQGAASKTFVYAVASQSSLASVSGADACKDAFAGPVEIKTGLPVSKPEIVWDALSTASPKDKTSDEVELGTNKQIFKKNGGANANEAAGKYWQAIQAPAASAPDYSAKTSPGAYVSPYTFHATIQGTMFVFLELPGYNSCPTVYSDTIKVPVKKSNKYIVKPTGEVCRVGKRSTIVLEIDPTSGDGPGKIKAGSYKWNYKPATASVWLEVPTTGANAATVGAVDECKLTWANHGLAAGSYLFRMAYEGSTTKDTTPNHPVTIQAEPKLLPLDALNLPDATCENVAKNVTLKSGVTAFGTVKLMFKSQDTATSTGWTEKASSTNTATYAARALADSGFYRAMVFTKEVCDTLTSYSRIMVVNKAPVKGTLAITTLPVCFGGNLNVALSGYTGQISGYEYNRSNTANDATTGWIPVLSPTVANPFPSNDLAASGGVYPATWNITGAKYGYTIRAKVTNGVCAPVYAFLPVKIYDTVAVATPPTDQKPVVDGTTKLPSGNVQFTATGKAAGAKYADGTSMEPLSAAFKVHWEYSDNMGNPGTWKDLKGTGISGEETGTVTIAPTGWTTLGIDEAKLKTSRFRMVISGSCKDTAITQTAKVSPQTDLTAGPVVSQTENDDHSPSGTGGCFFYGDTVVLFHNDASGQGTVSHHWRLSPSGTPIAATTKTLASEGIRFWFGKDNAGNLDSSRLYMLAPVDKSGTPADVKAFWDSHKDFVVIVTDDINKAYGDGGLFSADGSLKPGKNLVSKHFTNYTLCFEQKPVWKLPHDTICSSKADTIFALDMSTLAAAVEVNRLQVYLKAKSAADFEKVATYTGYGGETSTLTGDYAVNGKEITAELLLTNSKPNGKLEIKAKTPADKIDEVFDSTLVKMVIHTNYSQKNDTISAVLRIDKGIKEITATTNLVVCEGEPINFAGQIVRHQESILRPIEWVWQRGGVNVTDTRPNKPKSDNGDKSVKPGVASTIAKALPTDSTTSTNKWTLKATAKCGVAATKDYNVKVNVIPTWSKNLRDTTIKYCASDLIEFSATLNVNWSPNIVWEHAYAKTGPWTEVKPEGAVGGSSAPRVEIKKEAGETANQSKLLTTISPSALRDSGYYRIKVSKAGGICPGMSDLYSDTVHVSIDTLPLLEKISAPFGKNLRTNGSAEFITTVNNPPLANITEDCEQCNLSAAECEKRDPWKKGKRQEGTWYIMTPGANDDGTYNTAVPFSSYANPDNNVSVEPTTNNGKTYKIKVNGARAAQNHLKFFMMVQNCCGVSYTDTIMLTVTDNLAISDQKGDTVCEDDTVRLRVTANLKIGSANKRQWQYRAKATDAWTAVPLNNKTHPLFPDATETMTDDNVATLTIPHAPYALDGYQFRLGLTESSTVWSDVMTLIVKPVKNLKIFVEADPNPAPNESTAGFNKTTLTAKVAVVNSSTDTTWLSPEKLALYGYTEYKWYQVLKDMVTINKDGDSPDFTEADNHKDTTIFHLENLKRAVHDSSLYFVVLNSACVQRHSDTTLLRLYSDLHVEWSTDVWGEWVELNKEDGRPWPYDSIWLPAGTTVEDLRNYPDLPINTIIPLRPEDPDLYDHQHEHRMSFAYYISCATEDDEVQLNLDLIEGVMSGYYKDILPTREWQISYDRGATWTTVDPGEQNTSCTECPILVQKDRFAGYADKTTNGDNVPEGEGVTSLKGVWLRFIARAQIKLDENGEKVVLMEDDWGQPIYEYVYNDTSRNLEIVISEPVSGKDFRFKSDRNPDEAACAAHDYVFAVTPTHPSFHYQWSMMRPGDTGFVKIDTLPNIDTLTDRDTVFHYGFVKDIAIENGTKVRVRIGSLCGDTIIEDSIHVMTVKLDEVQNKNICADGKLNLKATAKDYGDKEPTYKWFINGVEVPGQTTPALEFSSSIIPGAAVNDDGRYEVRIVAYANEEVAFINRTACDSVEIMLRPLPTGINAKATPSTTTVEEGSTLSATISEGSTVLWSPADKVEKPTDVSTPAKGLVPGKNTFVVTVTTEFGCTAKDTVEVMVASTFALDDMTPVVIVPPTLPFDDNRDENDTIKLRDTVPQMGEYGAQRGGMVTADSMVIWACEKSVGFVTLHTSGGTPVLIYEWINPDGTPVDTLPGEGEEPAFHRLTAEEIHAYGYDSLVNDSTFAFYLDGKVNAFRCKITDKDGRGTTLVMKVGVLYYVTQHVALEAIPHMRHNRFYEDQSIFLSGHPTRFAWYSFYDYNVSRDELTKTQRSAKPVYATDYVEEEGEDRVVYVSVFDEHKCRSYDSVVIKVIPLPNAMILNDDGYPEGDLLFPEFEVEIHDSWGRLVKTMDQGRGWDGTRGGRQVQGGTYYYRVKLPTVDGHTFIKGAVTVFTKKK